MPCGCFGGGKKTKGKVKAPPSPLLNKDSPTIQVKGQDDPDKTAKRRDVVASYYADECALLGYKPTGSRPPSSCVDSPNSHTPSTEPLDAYSRDSSMNSSSPVARRSKKLQGALCRSQLADKRREFFRDFATPDYRSSPYALSSTLPARTRPNFGKPLRSTTSRPLSQPCEDESPLLPPGPHLLHPSPNDEREPKIDSHNLASQQFLLELKSASQEISRRWAMSEDELEEYPCSLKMKARNQLPQCMIIDEEFNTMEMEFTSDDSHSVPVQDPKSETVPQSVVSSSPPQVIESSVSQVTSMEYEDFSRESEITHTDNQSNDVFLIPEQSKNTDSFTSSNSDMNEDTGISEVLENVSVDIKNTFDEKFQVSPVKEVEKISIEPNLDTGIEIQIKRNDEPVISSLETVEEPNLDLDFQTRQEEHIISPLEDEPEIEISVPIVPEIRISHNQEVPIITPLDDFDTQVLTELDEPTICPLIDIPPEPEFSTQVLTHREEPLICNFEDIVEPEFATQVITNQDEPMISPLEDDDEDYNFVLDERSQTEMMQLLERESDMDNVRIVVNNGDLPTRESTIIVNPFVEETDQEEIITPHDSRLQLIAEEDLDESADDDMGPLSSLSSEDGELIVPSTSDTEITQTYEQETNVRNEKYNNSETEVPVVLNPSDHLESSEFVTDEKTINEPTEEIEEILSLPVQQQQIARREDEENVKEELINISGHASSEHSKLDTTEVTHDDGLGSEIEEGSDIIEDPQPVKIVQQESANKST